MQGFGVVHVIGSTAGQVEQEKGGVVVVSGHRHSVGVVIIGQGALVGQSPAAVTMKQCSSCAVVNRCS